MPARFGLILASCATNRSWNAVKEGGKQGTSRGTLACRPFFQAPLSRRESYGDFVEKFGHDRDTIGRSEDLRWKWTRHVSAVTEINIITAYCANCVHASLRRSMACLIRFSRAHASFRFLRDRTIIIIYCGGLLFFPFFFFNPAAYKLVALTLSARTWPRAFENVRSGAVH